MFDGKDIERLSPRSGALMCVRSLGRLQRMLSERTSLAVPASWKGSNKPTKSTPAPRPALRSFGAGGDFFSDEARVERANDFPLSQAVAAPFLNESQHRASCFSCLGVSSQGTLERVSPSFRIAKALPAGVVGLVMLARSGPSVCPRARFFGCRTSIASRRMRDPAKPNKSTPVPRSFLRRYGTGGDFVWASACFSS